ncbi:DEAD/DEAH box helicase [Methylotuvimicrobium alcaliphilum]|uniref:DEAD/H associated domain protein n=1 Tax=Methylotuvimicrobium alcaliphilum (strain DSM 19304 / NCIMB 14124 / VKM B-2133 / 20Z) TaxID=1091494 RepID=G4SXL2_META2|nr:crosslink repair DNA glycosylase YcaQ family protein [Methylotuvimicrobium alcaliphilum]CCE22067.1 DEAD/H associated domain protein [Methylotuvimicrobium alcaliphilum 20Z]
MTDSLSAFHPVVADWFIERFGRPSEAQVRAWPAIQSGASTLIAAPTGSGKTLAAFLAVIDQLVKQGIEAPLPDETRILYISPLKALSNDIHKNLEEPLTGIGMALLEAALPDIVIRAQVRTGDTSQAERAAMKRFPPHILVTTPESLYLLLTSESGREMLKSVRSVIVDEIHALAGNKRGAHLMLSLERLTQLTETEPVRIGLSATQKPLDGIARYLIGNRAEACTIIDTGHVRRRDLQIEVTGSPLEAVMAGEVWTEIYDRLEQLIAEHSTTLIFVNTRRQAERVAAALAERLGEEAVTSHHGSLAKEHRLNAEQRLKQGRLKALVATASLELGIDIGDVDLVCQLGSPHSISAFLQRVGRSGHRLGATPKGRLFPLSRDDLLECSALLYAVGQDLLDTILIPKHPLDVLAQQIVAEVACREWRETELYQAFCKAWPYRELTEMQFSAVVKMLADGFHTRRGRRGAYLHRDAVHGMLRPRKGARLTALLNGGAIPDLFDYDVILQPEGLFVGTLNEDFAFESLPGDIFQLGNNSYRLLKVEQGKVHVEDAHGQPPNIPFWFGEAPGRSNELSEAVSRLSAMIDSLLEQGEGAAYRYLIDLALPHVAAEQLSQYLAAAKAALTVLPTLETIVFERFFDETQDMHFVIHSPYGSRINRAWGLALRKRFCRKFNFELQAAASEDNIVLSLGPTHSFPLNEPAGYLKASTVKNVLIQALLAAPMFPTRWRWVTNTALAVPRNRAGKRVPAQFQRNNAEDLIAVIFPDQLACFENIAGDREIPDHPLVNQALWDCLHELMDIDGLEALLDGIESGRIKVVARDLSAPSPMAQEILNARPYAFLDDAPAEERRTLAIQQRRFANAEEAAEIGRLDPAAIERVRLEAWPEANTADELHDAMVVLSFIAEKECTREQYTLFEQLQQTGRAALLVLPNGNRILTAAERLHELQLLFPGIAVQPTIEAVDADPELTEDAALQNILRSRLEGLGPVTANSLADSLGLSAPQVEQALAVLEQQGFAIQGRFSPDAAQTEWCERGLLARIHRYTLKQLRNEIQPVAQADFMRFLFHWHGLDEPREGEAALEKVLLQLEGCNLPAAAWEGDVLPKRLKPYFASQLDTCCSTGRFVWLRLKFKSAAKTPRPAGKSTSIALLPRARLSSWRVYAPLPDHDAIELSSGAQKVYAVLKNWGASFFQEISDETGLLNAQLFEALGELVAAGLITADSFQGLRTLIQSSAIRQRRSRRYPAHDISATAGRWSLLRPVQAGADAYEPVEHIARVLLNRYGVVFRKLLDNEEGIPSWRDLLYVYRRLEARGEVRGGRFVQGLAGEHFALPQAVSMLRDSRKQAKTGELIAISTVDPLNLTGIIGSGDRVGPQTANRLLYRDGVLLASSKKNDVVFVETVEPEQEWQYKTALLRK